MVAVAAAAEVLTAVSAEAVVAAASAAVHPGILHRIAHTYAAHVEQGGVGGSSQFALALS